MPERLTPVAPGAQADFQLSQEPVTPPDAPPADAPSPAPAYEHLGELPANYGTSNVYLVAYDPRRLFAYWDLDATAVATVDAPLAIRVRRTDGGGVESQVDLGRAVSLLKGVAAGGGPGRYLPVTHPGAGYYVELGTGGGSTGMPWRSLAVSSHVVVPPEGLAAVEDGDARFATLPFHLSFQRLADLLHATVPAGGQPLTEALASLQRDAQVLPADAALIAALGRLDDEQRRNLQTVLGWEGDSSPSSPHGVVSSPGAAGGSREEGFPLSASAARAGGSEGLSSLGASTLASAGPTSGGLTSAGGVAPSSAAMFAARAAVGSEGARPSSAAFAAGLSSAALFGVHGAGASGIFGPAPSSEAWRRAAAANAVAGSSGGSDQFVRERAERFLRAITSSLDVLSPLFSGDLVAGGGGSSAGGSGGGSTSGR